VKQKRKEIEEVTEKEDSKKLKRQVTEDLDQAVHNHRDLASISHKPKFTMGNEIVGDANGQFRIPRGLCVNSKGEIIPRITAFRSSIKMAPSRQNLDHQDRNLDIFDNHLV